MFLRFVVRKESVNFARAYLAVLRPVGAGDKKLPAVLTAFWCPTEKRRFLLLMLRDRFRLKAQGQIIFI